MIDYLSKQMTLSVFESLEEADIRLYFSIDEFNMIKALKPQQRCARYLLKRQLSVYLSSAFTDQGDPISIQNVQNYHILKNELGAPYLSLSYLDQTNTPNRLILQSIQISITHEKQLIWVALAIDQALLTEELASIRRGG
jgi:hypothetical protein